MCSFPTVGDPQSSPDFSNHPLLKEISQGRDASFVTAAMTTSWLPRPLRALPNRRQLRRGRVDVIAYYAHRDYTDELWHHNGKTRAASIRCGGLARGEEGHDGSRHGVPTLSLPHDRRRLTAATSGLCSQAGAPPSALLEAGGP